MSSSGKNLTQCDISNAIVQEYEGDKTIAVSTVIGGGVLLPQAEALLKLKGCAIVPGGNDTFIISFPEETYRYEILPRTHDPRYRIRFKSGFELREVKAIGKHYNGLFVDSTEYKAFLRDPQKRE